MALTPQLQKVIKTCAVSIAWAAAKENRTQNSNAKNHHHHPGHNGQLVNAHKAAPRGNNPSTKKAKPYWECNGEKVSF